MLKRLFERLGAVQLHSFRTTHAVYLGAIIALFTGFSALVSWMGRWPALITARGTTMYLDTAISCILAGLGLLAAVRRRYTIARIIGVFLALAANLQLTANLAGFSVSVHKLCPNIAPQILSTYEANHVQISPATNVVFFLFGCALALLSRRMSNQVLALKAAVAVVISAKGVIVLFGYMSDGVRGPLSGAESGMAVLAALCTVILGASVCALCTMHWGGVYEELSPSSVVIAAIGTILILGGADTATIVKSRTALLSDSSLEVMYSEMRAVQRTVNSIRTAESSERGFVLTRDENLLASYTLAMTSLRADLGSKESVNLLQSHERDLPRLIAARMAQFEIVLELVRQHRHRDVLKLIGDRSGSALSDQIENEAAFVVRRLKAEALSREAARQRLLQNILNLILSSYLISIVLAAMTVVLARLAARQHERTSIRAATIEPLDCAKPEIPAEVSADQRHVLLIDDSQDLMLLVEQALQKYGSGRYRLSWAKCLKDSFCGLIGGGVDVVLLDLGLPESSGLISYAFVRGCAPEVPTIVLTSDDSPETKDLIVAAGVDHYLVKQRTSGDLLMDAIEGVLQSQRRPPQVNFRTLASLQSPKKN
jgi:CheY-like chemotaxis protein